MSNHPHRRHSDRFQDEPRATYAANNVTGNTVLCRSGSLDHAYMIAAGYEELDREGDHCLMRCPAGLNAGSVVA